MIKFPFILDKLYIMLVPYDLCDTHFKLQRLQGVCVVVRKDLCSGLRLGAKVTVIGAPTHKQLLESQCVEYFFMHSKYVSVYVSFRQIIFQWN